MSRSKKAPNTDPLTAGIKVVASKECSTISGKETLQYKVGRGPDGSLHLRVSSSSGSGFWNDHWVPAQEIFDILQKHSGKESFASTVLSPIYAGMSSNSTGFLAAACRAEGLLLAHKNGSRLHRVGDIDAFILRSAGTAPKAKATTQRKPAANAKSTSRRKPKASAAA